MRTLSSVRTCLSDSCIPVVSGKRLAFDLEHCKGCGICAYQCKFGAITMKEGK
ncbi:MAG: 4Fe-4S binding protein [Coprococcus sp.]